MEDKKLVRENLELMLKEMEKELDDQSESFTILRNLTISIFGFSGLFLTLQSGFGNLHNEIQQTMILYKISSIYTIFIWIELVIFTILTVMPYRFPSRFIMDYDQLMEDFYNKEVIEVLLLKVSNYLHCIEENSKEIQTRNIYVKLVVIFFGILVFLVITNLAF
jgi:hypothetical protein